ncbi:MAG TPA: DUF642 domain-containing protein, partial [Anaerolineales bacterium]
MRVISVLVIAALLAATPLAAFPAQAVGQAANPSQSGATLPNSTQVNGSDNLVVNGDFEQPVQLPGSEVYLDALPGWSFLMGTKVEIDNIPQQAHSGAQFLELDLNTARSIYQDLPTQPGMHYLLRFAYSPRPQRSAENNVLQVQWNGNQVGKLISADGSALTVPVWTVYQYILQATNATTRLQFTSPGTAPAPGFALDSVSLIPLGGNNNSWTRAQEIVLSPDLVTPQVNSGSAIEYLFESGSSDWFKFKVTPGSRAVIQLTNLPANYDLTLYKDIPTAYHTLTSPKDLARVGAEFAADAFSADAFSADAFSADAFSADAFSADAFSADAFSADAFSADAFSADAFSADAFSPDAFSADAFSADAFSADAFSPANLNPDAPNSFPPQAFTSAQVRSLIGISAFDGTSSEGISVNTWDNSGYFYIRVHGRNGSFSLDAPFHLSVLLSGGECALVSPVLPPSSLPATSGNYQTVILTDLARIPGTISEKSVLQKQLAAFAARPEVAGVVVDVAADPRVLAANRQADANPTCPYAKNLVAYAIKDIIDRYRTLNPLAYLVIVGNDNVIPFFRHPDQALLASEKNFIPPVRDGTASQASLKLGYFLSQDRYASAYDISAKAVSLPIPDLAIGRLVETATDITGMLDAYLQTSGGEAPRPTSSLVTGYDFLAKTAQAIQVQLEAGT